MHSRNSPCTKLCIEALPLSSPKRLSKQGNNSSACCTGKLQRGVPVACGWTHCVCVCVWDCNAWLSVDLVCIVLCAKRGTLRMVFVWQLRHADGFLLLFWELRKTIVISGLQFSSDFGDLKPILAELTSGRQIAGPTVQFSIARVACRGRGERGSKTLFRTSALLQTPASASKRKRVPTPK